MTELVLDPSLPTKTWELRSVKGKVIKRFRYEVTEELLVEALENRKAARIAFGEEAHRHLVLVMAKPGTKTPTQRAAEEEAKLSRARPGPRPKTIESPRCGQGFRLDPLPWDRGPRPPGTSGPGGVAS